ncbi:MAG: type II toxin-antitoxin system HicB family antitoxin [Candidatus Bathyarchaeia archaeon]
MTRKIAVCLEVGLEGTGAFVPECPGCWVFGRSPESALAKVRTAVAEWFDWLKRHGERVPAEAGDFEIEIAEFLRVSYNPVEAGKPEPLFWSEVAPVTRKDVAWTLKLMEHSREDLLGLVSNLSNEVLDWLPPGKPRTIRNCLRHIAYVEPWYITRLNVELPIHYPRNVFELLSHTRKVVVDYLRNMPRDRMRGVFQPIKDKSPMCNLWTARKVLRRLVDHEKLHSRYIAKVLQTYSELGKVY